MSWMGIAAIGYFIAETVHTSRAHRFQHQRDDIYIMMQCLFVTKNHHFLGSFMFFYGYIYHDAVSVCHEKSSLPW